MTDQITELLIASLRLKRAKARRERLARAPSALAALAHAQTAQARRLGYRDAPTRYDGKGN